MPHRVEYDRHATEGSDCSADVTSQFNSRFCEQCLQQHHDPVTGTETVVFSCFNQDQEMDRVDFRTLRRRLSQNGVQEKLTKLWVDRCLQHLGERPAIAAE